MSSLSKKLSRVGSGAARALRTATNPLSVVENKLIEKVAPGYSNLENQALNPFSNLNKNIAWTLVNPQNALNPVQTALTPVKVISQITTEATTKKTEPTVKPNYESYSKSAGSAAHKAGLARAKAEREQATKESIANAQKANAAAYQNMMKAKAAQAAKEAEETPAAQAADQANATGTSDTAAAQAEYINNTMDTAALLNALAAARGAGMAEYYLPEQEVKSDFFKYLVLGGALLIGFYAIKKMK